MSSTSRPLKTKVANQKLENAKIARNSAKVGGNDGKTGRNKRKVTFIRRSSNKGWVLGEESDGQRGGELTLS